MARARTTKGLAKRIALDYFTKPSPLRSARARLSWGVGLAGVAIAAAAMLPALVRLGAGARGGAPSGRIAGAAALAESLVSPGKLSEPHAQFETECARCHGGAASAGFLAKASDEACSVCHDGPIHQQTQRAAPRCVSCHAEHRGRALARVQDAACTACHAALDRALADGAAGRGLDPRITAFEARRGASGGHPEFAAARRPDPSHLKLNHRAHLELKRKWLASQGQAPLTCGSCHEPDRDQRLMRPVTYEEHCSRCHLLAYDVGGLFAEPPFGPLTPHESPRTVHVDLTSVFTEEIARHPERLGSGRGAGGAPFGAGQDAAADRASFGAARDAAADGRRLPGTDPPPPPPKTAQEWIARQVAIAENVIFGKDCALCHELAWPGSGRLEDSRSLAGEAASVHTAGSVDGGDAAHPAAAAAAGADIAATAGRTGTAGGAPTDDARHTGNANPDLRAAAPREDNRDPLGRLPVVVPTSVLAIWLPRARFEHRAHRFLDCETACHGSVRQSRMSADVLVPGLETCAECHRTGRSRADCVLCHDYHDRTRERSLGGAPALAARASSRTVR